MSKVINFNEYKSKLNRVEDTEHARKYLFSLNSESLEISIADEVIDQVYTNDTANVRLNFSKIAREQGTTVYKVKKAYNNLIDNKLLVDVSIEPRRHVLVSSKNLILACNFTDCIEAYL